MVAICEVSRFDLETFSRPGEWHGSAALAGLIESTFFAKGSIDQYVIIVPSERLIVVHFGRSPNLPPDADGVYQLVQDVIAATSHSGRPAAGH